MSLDLATRFARDGFAVVSGVLDPVRHIAPVVEERNRVLDRVAARLVTDGLVSSTYDALPFPERLIKLSRECPVDFSLDLDITLTATADGVSDITLGPALLDLLTSERLLDAVEAIVGPEVSSSPIQHFRWKLPRQITESSTNALIMRTPLHQDAAVVLPEADDTPILTVWVPLCDVSKELGPLCVVPGSHRRGLLTHRPRVTGLTVADEDRPEREPIGVAVRAGDVIFQSRHMVHASLDNVSAGSVRLSLDVRYQPTGLPTGRPYLPPFVARSRSQPHTELRDAGEWSAMWDEARSALRASGFPAGDRWSAVV
ncbi:MAG: hypothetical protein QOI20_2209 [Acidimicrobiaceae bacterium]|nr:hypothetical protein [Acidimicrobiaceae bacterium]